jgi:MFS family permease
MAGWLVRRFGERGLLLWGGGGLAVLLMAIALAPHWGVVLAAQVLCGLAFFMFHGVLQARATEALPEARGTAVSAFAMALFLGQTVGSLVFAGVIAKGGYVSTFTLTALAMLPLTLISSKNTTREDYSLPRRAARLYLYWSSSGGIFKVIYERVI